MKSLNWTKFSPCYILTQLGYYIYTSSFSFTNPPPIFGSLTALLFLGVGDCEASTSPLQTLLSNNFLLSRIRSTQPHEQQQVVAQLLPLWGYSSFSFCFLYDFFIARIVLILYFMNICLVVIKDSIRSGHCGSLIELGTRERAVRFLLLIYYANCFFYMSLVVTEIDWICPHWRIIFVSPLDKKMIRENFKIGCWYGL